jgi:hypothetical protein
MSIGVKSLSSPAAKESAMSPIANAIHSIESSVLSEMNWLGLLA